ncbi:BCCT family transporter [Aliidiomarina halalkaliphila]|uniref:BCCT family transporter n=1 Tax=Aliidiomarina halalkaliphila TaxID=2593535 RepID=A0A552X5C3_9GAMM|nr:choline BCCT transporter BetT [Aliidiomarina halalkaliphila]TRW50222.1 BCCT family transporter [Aliidiomarina halalkaliphila]
MGTESAKPRILWNPPVFIGSGVIAAIFVFFGIFAPTTANATFSAVQSWIMTHVGWYYVMVVALFLIFVAYLAFSRFGLIKLGPDHSTPDYSYKSWFAMLFSAGMGIGLMFFGVAEPVMHYIAPPVGVGENFDAAREAMNITFFHWGLHAWAIYAVVALSLAYFAFRHNLPLTIRSSLYPLIGDRIYGPIGHTVDTFAVVGTLFGVATSLGFGVLQINSGLNALVGIDQSVWVQIALIVIITAIATVSVVLGLDGGIRRISELNLFLAVGLLIFVLIAGPTVYLLQSLVQNIGTYLSSIVSMTFNLYSYDPSTYGMQEGCVDCEPNTWLGGWTLFYWGWWIAWSPFVGMFIARVSRGRTIREFVTGVLLVPMGFTFMWMTFFGNTAIHLILMEGMTSLSDAVMADSSVALFQFFEALPFSTLASIVATILVVTFFVTSSDSGSLVVDIITSGGGDEDSPTWQRIFWCTLEGLIAIALLLAGGLGALQTASIASALPFSIVMLLMCWGLIRALRLEVVKRVSLESALNAPAAQGNWQQQLRRLVRQPSKDEVLTFIDTTATAAMTAVAAELEKQNITVKIERGDDGRVWLQTEHGDEMDFFYSVRPREYRPPSFVMRDVRKGRDEKLKFYQAEVHLREGGQDYDIYGWSKDQVISDILQQYERHWLFLDAVR